MAYPVAYIEIKPVLARLLRPTRSDIKKKLVKKSLVNPIRFAQSRSSLVAGEFRSKKLYEILAHEWDTPTFLKTLPITDRDSANVKVGKIFPEATSLAIVNKNATPE